VHYSDTFITGCISSGARGFLSKECTIEKLVDAINSVYRQGYYFDDKISKALLFSIMENKDITPTCSDVPLTKREVEIAILICQGKTNKGIADTLYISVRTVEVHRKHIAKKTHATNTAGVVIYAIRNGIYQIS